MHLAKELGWKVTMTDFRESFTQFESISRADEIVTTMPESLAEEIAIDDINVAILMTYKINFDER